MAKHFLDTAILITTNRIKPNHSQGEIMKNDITIRVPIAQFREVTFSRGMCMLLSHTLFPRTAYQASTDRYVDGVPCKVTAIKAVRAELNIGLKEAKDIVDGLTRELLEAHPQY